MWRLLRTNRDFRLLYFGSLISLGGHWFLTVALLDLALQLTGSATLASLMLLCQTLPIFLVTPIAGRAVDRLDRRKLMIVVDLLRCGACLLPLFARTPALLPFAYAGVIAISIGSAYFEPASQAALPNIVAADDLHIANVLMGSTWGTMLAVGAAIGGAVTMRFGRDVSFVAGALGIGLLFAARGLGALFGPFLLRAVGSRRDDLQYRLIGPAVLLFGIGYMCLGRSHSLLAGGIAVFAAHLGGGAQWQTSTYGLQRETPDWIRGRVFGADYGFVTLTMSISSLGAGIASDRFGPTAATVGVASIAILWAL